MMSTGPGRGGAAGRALSTGNSGPANGAASTAAAGAAATAGGGAAAKKPILRWSNKFDLIRVLLHKMRVPVGLAGDELGMAERTASNAAVLLAEVVKHSTTHVDLLKNIMQGAKQLLEVALGVPPETFHPLQCKWAWGVVIDLCRCLSRIWLPNRQTRIISETIQVYLDHLPVIKTLFVSPPQADPQRLGFFRLQVVELVSVVLSGRLVSLFAEQMVRSGLLQEIVDMCWKFPMASLYHQVVFTGVLLPMIHNCITPLGGAASSASSEDVYGPAAGAVTNVVHELRLWDRIVENHFSYNPESEERRNRFAFNGYLTQLANALIATTIPVPPNVMPFVSGSLDWTNALETTPVSAALYSSKMDTGKKSPSSSSSVGASDDATESDSDEGEGGEDDDDDDDPEPVAVALKPARTLGKSRVAFLAEPPNAAQYESPPRPREGEVVVEDANGEKVAELVPAGAADALAIANNSSSERAVVTTAPGADVGSVGSQPADSRAGLRASGELALIAALFPVAQKKEEKEEEAVLQQTLEKVEAEEASAASNGNNKNDNSNHDNSDSFNDMAFWSLPIGSYPIEL